MENIDSKFPHINTFALNELAKKDRRSFYLNENDIEVLHLRGVNIDEDGLIFNSKSFIFSKEYIFEFDHEHNETNLLKEEYSDFFRTLEQIYNRNSEIIENYIDEIDLQEDSVFERKASRVFVDVWFDLKKDLTRIERHLQRNLAVLSQFSNEHTCYIKDCDSKIRKIVDSVQVNLSNVSVQLIRLDHLYNYFSSIKNDKLNKNIYILTLFSAIFLPLNLIVGFFGMNTENLFFKGNSNGTTNVLFVLIASFLISIFGLPIIRFIDHNILKFFLGRSDIYKKMSNKIDRIFKID